MQKNLELHLARDFVEKTDRNIFLTGKAGTGKTTFLHSLKLDSLKRLVVVAPTGVAAINAKGVTIHSFFQIPFGPILPGSTYSNNSKTQYRFSKLKINIIKSLDLLVIDEISMVRADLLDGIDQVLRRYKNRNKVFGGVQVLMIGDLQQLSPVVKDNEWEMLKPHYKTPYFFSSHAFIEANAISIELKHIYRQDNQKFIKILNEIRNNTLSENSAKELNNRYIPDFSPKEEDGYITLTTHNHRANTINEIELNKLESKTLKFQAQIEGKFQEYSYPTLEELNLKVGAQVMFIKNDSSPEKRYFNGKIGKIISLNKDEVSVYCQNDSENILITTEKWDNVNYTIHPDTKEISENIIGSFTQIPLRLAWAITIHKSQGLTFENAIIDAKSSFAHGQTYVALSRCKTLEGLVLMSPINNESIITDNRVVVFNENISENQPDETILNQSQKTFQLNLIEELLNFYTFLHPINRLIDVFYTNKNSFVGDIINPLQQLKEAGIQTILKVNAGFKSQLNSLSKNVVSPEKDAVIQERIKRAIVYFIKHTNEKIKEPFERITFSTEDKSLEKEFEKHLDTIETTIAIKLYCLQGLIDSFSTKEYLTLRAKAILQKAEKAEKTTNKKEYKATTDHPILFEQLRNLRSIIATEKGLAHYQIFTQRSLYEMCEMLPLNKKQLKVVNGMGKVRVEKYGDEILEIINEYADDNNIEIKEIVIKERKPKKENTKLVSLQMFKKGMSISEIALKRDLVITTIEGHLYSFITSGEVIVFDLISEERYDEIKNKIQKINFESLTDLKNKIDDKFSYSELRIVLNSLESKRN